jgi:hypothetical protein
MSWTEYTPHAKTHPQLPAASDSAPVSDPLPLVGHVELKPIETASADDINARSTSELVPVLNSASRKLRLAPPILLLSIVFFVGAISQANQLWLALSALYATAFVPLALLLDRYRRSVKVLYDDEGVVAQINEALAVAFNELANCRSVWAIHAEGRITDWKRNAGAAGQIRRSKTTLRLNRPDCFRGKVKFPAFKLRAGELFLLPDAALVIVRGAIAAVSYRDLDFTMPAAPFIEEESVPSDTTIVSHTWRYVNKSGGPDRRFSGNSQLPVCLYREINFRTESGLNCKFQVSNSDAANDFYKVVEALRRTTVDLPQSIKYIQNAKRWPSVVFISLAILLGAAQLVFLKDGFKYPTALFASLGTGRTNSSDVQRPSGEVSGGQQLLPARPAKPPIELAPVLPPDTVRSDTKTKDDPLDLNDVQNVLWVQARLRELGFLHGATRGWDASARSALREFKTFNGLPADERWDFETEEGLASRAALRAEQTFVGSWSEKACEPGAKPDLSVTSRRAVSSAGGVCEFSNVKPAGAGWSVLSSCSNGGEKWIATIRLSMIGNTLSWIGRDGSETQYARCR